MVFCDGRAVISSQIGAAPAFIWPFTYRCCTNIYLTFHISALHQHLSDHSHIGAAPAFIWPFTYRCCTSIYLTFHILALHQHLSDLSHIGAWKRQKIGAFTTVEPMRRADEHRVVVNEWGSLSVEKTPSAVNVGIKSGLLHGPGRSIQHNRIHNSKSVLSIAWT